MPSNKDFTLELRAQELGLDLKPLEKELERQFEDAIRQTANAAYAAIVAKAKSQLGSLQQEYLKGLDFRVLGKNQYLIVLDGSFANAIERGIPPHDMKDTMLKSKSLVTQGPRAGLPWVQTAKDGHKFAHVPRQHSPSSKANPEAQRLGGIIKGLTAMNRQGRAQRITSIFKDSYGRPLEGNVASVGNVGIKDLDNLVKYQKVSKTKSGKTKVESVYMTYRTISENSPEGKWQNPGRDALNAFKEAEELVSKELDNILRYFLG